MKKPWFNIVWLYGLLGHSLNSSGAAKIGPETKQSNIKEKQNKSKAAMRWLRGLWATGSHLPGDKHMWSGNKGVQHKTD